MIFLAMGKLTYGQFTKIPLNTVEDIHDIALDEDTIVILGKRDYLAKSYDLGESVVELNCPVPAYRANYDIQVVDGQYYFYSQRSFPYNAKILKSSTKGQSWTEILQADGLFPHLEMYDTTLGILGGITGVFLIADSIDTQWEIDDFSGNVSASQFYNDSIGILMSISGVAYVTEDRGQNWEWRNCNATNYYQIQYINQDTIYALGSLNSDATFVYSFDGNSSFQNRDIENNTPHPDSSYSTFGNDMWFENAQHGYIFGAYRHVSDFKYACIYETNDYGVTWRPHLLNYSGELRSFKNLNDSIGFISGDNGLLLKWDKTVPLSYFNLNIDKNKKSNFSIFPNPAHETIKIDVPISLQENMALVFYDLTGKKIAELPYSNQVMSIDFLKSGIYLVSLKSDEKVIKSSKLVKY